MLAYVAALFAKLGAKFALVGAAVGAFLLFLWSIYAKGKTVEKQANAMANLQAAVKSHEDAATLRETAAKAADAVPQPAAPDVSKRDDLDTRA